MLLLKGLRLNVAQTTRSEQTAGTGAGAAYNPWVPDRITSKANARLRALRAALAGRDTTVIGIEGLHLVQEALRSGLILDVLFLREDRADLLKLLPELGVLETVVVSVDAFNSAATTAHAQGVAALLSRPMLQYQCQSGDLLVIADGLQDPGNLGTLIRSAEAFGAAAVVLSSNTVDPWNGKCLRAAAGAALRLPLVPLDDALLTELRAASARLFAAVARSGTPAHLARLSGTSALIIGNEGAGVSPDLLAIADERITLATPGPTESLNAAVAGSLLLYEASQQRLRMAP